MTNGDGTRLTRYRLTAAVAQRRVQQLALDSKNLRWTTHIRERMPERGIDSEDVLRVLRNGVVEEAPIEGTNPGEWKIKIVRKLANGRMAGVVTVLISDKILRLLTAEWEDHR